jgi:hypothetical protein
MKDFKSFSETMGVVYADYYAKNGEQKTFDFVLKSHVSLYVLNNLYENFMLGGGIDEMSKISQEKKEKYWKLACEYFTDLPDRLKASKAAYVLELITSNF